MVLTVPQDFLRVLRLFSLSTIALVPQTLILLLPTPYKLSTLESHLCVLQRTDMLPEHPTRSSYVIARWKRDDTCAETRFGLSAKRTSPFKLAGASVKSTTGSRHVRISGSNGKNAGYTMFRVRVQDYWLHTPLACFPFTSPTVRHRVPSGFN